MIGKHSINRILSTIDIKNTSCRLNTYLNTFQPEKENFSNTMSPKKGVFIKKVCTLIYRFSRNTWQTLTNGPTDRRTNQHTIRPTNRQSLSFSYFLQLKTSLSVMSFMEHPLVFHSSLLVFL